MIRGWKWAAAALLLTAPAVQAAPADAAYEAALDRYYELTIGHELATLNIDKVVESFRQGATGKLKEQDCAKLTRTMDEFADKEFRTAAQKYFTSPALREEIEGALRKHLTLEDLNAYLAFADTPAGRRYIEHNRLASGEAERAVEASAEKLFERPEFQEMLSQLFAKVMPVMLECQKK